MFGCNCKAVSGGRLPGNDTPKKIAAHTAVYIATRNGTLTKPEACSRCGVVSSIVHGHHPNYEKPLDVIWLCRRCHDEHHWPIPTDLVGGNV